MSDLDDRYAEHRPPEMRTSDVPGRFEWLCYVCGELTDPARGNCRDCGATWDAADKALPDLGSSAAVREFAARKEAQLIESMQADEAGWANDSVVARFPAGTDPLKAIREVVTVGMERTDGSNALPWWLRSDVTWWHGSINGIRRGAELMPPSITGIVPHVAGSDLDSVYVTRSRGDATMYACWHRAPMLYEVSFTGEPQPDDVLDDPDSFRVPRATVVRTHGLTRPEVESALNKVFASFDQPIID